MATSRRGKPKITEAQFKATFKYRTASVENKAKMLKKFKADKFETGNVPVEARNSRTSTSQHNSRIRKRLAETKQLAETKKTGDAYHAEIKEKRENKAKQESKSYAMSDKQREIESLPGTDDAHWEANQAKREKENDRKDRMIGEDFSFKNRTKPKSYAMSDKQREEANQAKRNRQARPARQARQAEAVVSSMSGTLPVRTPEQIKAMKANQAKRKKASQVEAVKVEKKQVKTDPVVEPTITADNIGNTQVAKDYNAKVLNRSGGPDHLGTKPDSTSDSKSEGDMFKNIQSSAERKWARKEYKRNLKTNSPRHAEQKARATARDMYRSK